jgi:hypothetical protein
MAKQHCKTTRCQNQSCPMPKKVRYCPVELVVMSQSLWFCSILCSYEQIGRIVAIQHPEKKKPQSDENPAANYWV